MHLSKRHEIELFLARFLYRVKLTYFRILPGKKLKLQNVNFILCSFRQIPKVLIIQCLFFNL